MQPLRPRTIENGRRCRGTAMTEAVLVTIPLLMVVGLAPWIAGMFLDLQEARTEAHRDMFDKTHSMLILPEAVVENHLQGPLDAQFPGGALTGSSRWHRFPDFPVDVPDALTSEVEAPDATSLSFTETLELDLFDEGFPNSPVEGWEFVEREGATAAGTPMHFLTYAAVIRSPWTWLGYPWVTSQDLIYEPSQMQSWVEKLQAVDDGMREAYKLAE